MDSIQSLSQTQRGRVLTVKKTKPTWCVFFLFQMNLSSEDMASLTENNSSALDASKSGMSNMTIIVSGNGAIIQNGMFLNTVAAQVLSGIFVWSALLITCHQVSMHHFTKGFHVNHCKYVKRTKITALQSITRSKMQMHKEFSSPF